MAIGKTLFFALIILSGCYTKKKASQQHSRAVAAFPELGADYCNRTYPCLPEYLGSDTIVQYDTLWGITPEIIDTLYLIGRDTTIVEVTKIKERQVNKTVTVHDTILVTNRAAIDLCNIEKRNLQIAYEKQRSETDKYRKRSRNRLYILIGLGSIGLLWMIFFIRRKVTSLGTR